MAATEMTEMVLNNLGNTAIYVIGRDDFRILYFNSRVKEVSPEIAVGEICREVWSGSCENCPIKGMNGRRTNTTVNYDDPFGEIVDLCATEIEWGRERIPAYLISVTPHVSSREELRRSEESRLKEKIVNSTLDAAMEQMFEEIVYFNVPRGEIIFRKGSGFLIELGESPELAGPRMFDGLHPADIDKFRETLSKESIERAFAAGRNSIQAENRRIGCDGRYHWISTRIMRMEATADGEDTALALASCIDARKQLETEKNELICSILTLFRELFVLDLENGKFLIYKIDRSARQLVEDEDYREFSRKYGEMLVHPADRNKFYDAFSLDRLRERVKNGEKKIAVEIRRRDAEGNYRYSELLATLLEVEEESVSKVVLTYRDVNELVRARRDEKYANQRFISAVHNSYDAIFEGELYSDELYCWKADSCPSSVICPTISGQIAWAAENIIHPDYRSEFTRVLSWKNLEKEFLSGKREVSFQVPRLGTGEGYRWYSFLIQLLEMKTGSIRVMFYLKDVDDLKTEGERKQRELKRALDMAERANAAKTDFLSRMSHDIRTPMNAILGMASIARENLERPEKLKDCLGKIDVSAQFLLSLINDVLDMSKIESGRMVLSERETDFYELLEGVKVICLNQSTDKKQRFTASIGSEVRRFYISDPLRLNQIIINLTSNAFKYTPEGGEIRLSVDAVGIKDGVQEIRIEISDNGIGMSEEFMKKMYEPFEQENTGGGRVFEGTGLGLAITFSLVQMMGGTLEVRSRIGEGTNFVVTLPLRLSERTKTAGESGEGSRSSGAQCGHFDGERILLVEDNAINREIAQTLLEARGLVIETADNGRIAVETFEASAPDAYQAILMDIRMPVMDGLEATRRIRSMSREDAVRIPIIAMTANAFQDEQEEAFLSGIDGYLTKPVDAEQMCGCLEKMFDKAKKIGKKI